MADLRLLGWNDSWEAAFAAHRAKGLIPGRVAIEDKHAYIVFTTEGECPAGVSGKLIHQSRSPSDLPKVGDWVAVAHLPQEKKAVIHGILPRQTRITRKVPGRELEEQVLATNIDVAFIVQALDASFNLRQIERFLVMARDGGTRAVVLLNKADLCDDPETLHLQAQTSAGEIPVLIVCARTRRNLKALRAFIRPAETVVFIGPSGVGKSSLINRLYGDDIQATLKVRESDAKGRHSTTWRELIILPDGGLVIDTPGMREFHLWTAGDTLAGSFPEIGELAAGCRFRDCAHQGEQHCAVKTAVAEGRLPQGRYDSYLKLQREIAYLTSERRQHTYLSRKRSTKPDDYRRRR